MRFWHSVRRHALLGVVACSVITCVLPSSRVAARPRLPATPASYIWFLTGVNCPTSSRCIAVGGQNTILLTTNGGASWTRQADDNSPWQASSSDASLFFGISCANDNHCVAVGDQGLVATTYDGGASWDGQNNTDNLFYDQAASCSSSRSCIVIHSIQSVSCPDSNDCVAVGDATIIVASNDGGASWRHQDIDTNHGMGGVACAKGHHCGIFSNLGGVSCPSSGHCVAVGGTTTIIDKLTNSTYTGDIYVTGKGGTSWHRQRSGIKYALYGISCPDNNHCITVGSTILASSDGGTSWHGQRSGAKYALASISCPDSSHCVAVGGAGTILVTTDGGTSWHPHASGTNDLLTGVSCADSRHCTVVGYDYNDQSNSIILVTGDGGATWLNQTANVT